MASRIMHLVISNEISKRFDIDRARFAFGNILPDAHDNTTEMKKASHFKIKGARYYSEKILDSDLFVEKYNKFIKDDIYLGYLSHLISDDLWMRTIYRTYMLDSKYNVMEDKLDLYYSDFAKLNTLLINEFGIGKNIVAECVEIDEICKVSSSKLLKWVNFDFENRMDNLKLDIFKIEDIRSFIECAVEEVVTRIKEQNLRDCFE
jgi:hypothetical protein